MQVRVAERLRFTVTTDLCVQAQPIETLWAPNAAVDLTEEIPELPAPPVTSPLSAHRRYKAQEERKEQQLEAQKLQNIIKSKFMGRSAQRPGHVPLGASAAQQVVSENVSFYQRTSQAATAAAAMLGR